MHFVPIISTLRRHKTAATLVVLEIALTCAIVSNAVFLIGNRLDRMHKASGVAERVAGGGAFMSMTACDERTHAHACDGRHGRNPATIGPVQLPT